MTKLSGTAGADAAGRSSRVLDPLLGLRPE